MDLEHTGIPDKEQRDEPTRSYLHFDI